MARFQYPAGVLDVLTVSDLLFSNKVTKIGRKGASIVRLPHRVDGVDGVEDYDKSVPERLRELPSGLGGPKCLY